LSGTVEVRVKLGANEVEIKGDPSSVREFLDMLLPIISGEREAPVEGQQEHVPEDDIVPPIQVSEKEPVSEILLKLFSTSWARKPRSLSEVISALNSLGLYYQKTTVAVNLKRLVQRGKLRRIRGKDGTFLYVPVVPPQQEGQGVSG